jgi:hypothetical protein
MIKACVDRTVYYWCKDPEDDEIHSFVNREEMEKFFNKMRELKGEDISFQHGEFCMCNDGEQLAINKTTEVEFK